MKTRVLSQFDQGYVFNRKEIEESLTPAYLQFLKEAGIADLDKTPDLFVAKYVLKKDERVEGVIREQGLNCKYAKDRTVVNIPHQDARKLVYNLGGIVLPVGVMYKLIIPGLKQAAGEGNESAGETLEQMIKGYAEWLEDQRVSDKKRLKIGTSEITIVLPDIDGIFDREDIDEFGYPTNVEYQGEFHYWKPRRDEGAAVRDGGSGLGLDLDWGPFNVSGRLGVRLAKFFSGINLRKFL